MPWSLKGISDEAREFAKLAADKSEVPVGAWLSQVIRAAAGAPVADPMADHAAVTDSPPAQSAPVQTEPVPAPAPEPRETPGDSTIERAAQIVDDFGFEPEGPARDADLIEDPAILQTQLLALERRLANAETNTQNDLTPLMEEIERIRARLAGAGNS